MWHFKYGKNKTTNKQTMAVDVIAAGGSLPSGPGSKSLILTYLAPVTVPQQQRKEQRVEYITA